MCILYYNKSIINIYLDLGLQKKNYIFHFIDGLVEDDGVIEIKCPFGAKDSISFEEAILNKKVNIKVITYALLLVVTNKAAFD